MSVLTKQQARPFLKWAGGKGQLIRQIREHLPKELTHEGRIKNYLEPFLGGGAVFFWLSGEFDFEKVCLYEMNAPIVNGYQTIKSKVAGLIDELKDLEDKYITISAQGKKKEDFYYERRSELNGMITSKKNNECVRASALLIFLNKTCFNGLYRVNTKGEFNVPFGCYKNPTICDKENLMAVKAALRNAEIFHGDFSRCLDCADNQSFIYFDPPYRPLSKTANFTGYCQENFDDNEQRRLKEVFDALDKKGAKVMLSNSDPKNYEPTNNFFDHLYRKYRIVRVNASRMINSNASKRGGIKEILIMNY